MISHFGSGVAVARALGITRSAVSQWRQRVPLEQALKVESVTEGALVVNMADYGLPTVQSRTRKAQRATA